MSCDQRPILRNTSADLVSTMAKATFGMVPVVGSLAAEIVGNIIPNQRVDRIVHFIKLLDERLGRLEQESLRTKVLSPPVVDILEDAFNQAARATTEERLEHIANVVAKGISAEELDQGQIKRMLWLLAQLTDEEIIILRSSLAQTIEDLREDAEFREKHELLLAPHATHLGSGKAEIEEAALKPSYREHLFDLGLSRRRFRKPKQGELPEFDDRTGTMKSNGSEITTLGRMFLGSLDLIPGWYRS